VIAGWSPDETWWLRRERVRVVSEQQVMWRRDANGEWRLAQPAD
jgi:hypothetical protein